jgi:hypothetical protein
MRQSMDNITALAWCCRVRTSAAAAALDADGTGTGGTGTGGLGLGAKQKQRRATEVGVYKLNPVSERHLVSTLEPYFKLKPGFKVCFQMGLLVPLQRGARVRRSRDGGSPAAHERGWDGGG